MQIIDMPIEKIKPFAKNNKGHSARQIDMIANSIKEFWFRNPIIIDKNNEVIAWHGRLLAAKQLWLDKAPCIMASDLTEKQVRAYRLLDNRIGDFGTYDILNIAEELKDIGDMQLWLESMGDLFKDILPAQDNEEAKEDDYSIPDEIQTDIKIGDIFDIGPHRLICWDSTQQDTFRHLFGDRLADLVVTDPPYNVNYEGKTKKALKIDNDNMDDDTFYEFLFDFYSCLAEYTKKGWARYVWHADSEGANFRLAMKNAWIMVKQCLIWIKNSMVLWRQDYQRKHEPCLYGRKEWASHWRYSDRKQTTVLEFDRPSRNAEHPTMKPVPLIAYQITNSSKQWDIVADAFAWSWTTMVASHQLGRVCYSVEYDPKYCQVIVDRMIKLDPTLKIIKNWLPYNTAYNG